MKATLARNINDTFNELNDILFSFSEEQFNTIPYEGSWTAGQVTEHIIKSLTGTEGLFNGPVEPVTRDAGEKIKALEELFLNYDIKMKSPDFILPSNDRHTKDPMVRELEKFKSVLLNWTESELSLLCKAAEMPGFGELTRLEWIHFFLFHTQRHTQQIKNIFHTLK